jgi:hypothetical protein
MLDVVLVPVLLVLSVVFVVAGLGYRRAALALPAAGLVALLGAGIVTAVLALILEPSAPRNEWRGIGLFVGVLYGAASAGPLFIVSYLFLVLRRGGGERRKASPMLLIAAALVLVVAAIWIGPWIGARLFGRP